VIGTGFLLTLAFVLAVAATAKLSESVRLVPAAELIIAASVVLAPGRIAGWVVAVAFAAFTVAHARDLRAGPAGCDCFGAGSPGGASASRSAAITAASAAGALAVAFAGAPSIVQLAGDRAGAPLAVIAAAAGGAVLWRLAFSLRAGAPDAIAQALVRTSALALERRFTRRTVLQRVALVGSALAVAPVRYLLYPGTALAAIAPGDCASGLCTDGYTAFCCQINNGLNSCPEGTFPGGWWMCTDYAGRLLCAAEGVRYYVDCNALPGQEYAGGCQCAGGTCAERRVACNVFRYGQCNAEVPGVTAVVCRMVMCENPSTVPSLHCSASLAVDDAVCGHDAPCLVPPPPPAPPPLPVPRARELAGAGGV